VLPSVELPVHAPYQEGATRHHGGIEGRGGPPHPHVDPHHGPLRRCRVPERVLDETEHHGGGAIVEGGEGVTSPHPAACNKSPISSGATPLRPMGSPSRHRQRHDTGVLGVELSLRLRNSTVEPGRIRGNSSASEVVRVGSPRHAPRRGSTRSPPDTTTAPSRCGCATVIPGRSWSSRSAIQRGVGVDRPASPPLTPAAPARCAQSGR
jgi:hypothetical protein